MITRAKFKSFGASLMAGTAASVLGACVSTSVGPGDAVAAPAPLTQPQSDAAFRDRAPLATQAADAAVRVVEQPGADFQQEAYRVHIADQKVDIVRAQAETRLAQEQPPRLRTESERARLQPRTRESDLEQDQVALTELEDAAQTLAAITARGEAGAHRATATSDPQAPDARREAECAQLAASISRQQTAAQQPEGDLLQASVTGSGLVVTLAGFAIFR